MGANLVRQVESRQHVLSSILHADPPVGDGQAEMVNMEDEGNSKVLFKSLKK